MSILTKVIEFSVKYPVTRGMASYAVIWPLGSVIQQTMAGVEEYDYAKIARFCLYGSCYVAPTLHTWLRIARHLWPKNDLPSALKKVSIILSLVFF